MFITFFLRALYEKVASREGRVGQIIDDNMA